MLEQKVAHKYLQALQAQHSGDSLSSYLEKWIDELGWAVAGLLTKKHNKSFDSISDRMTATIFFIGGGSKVTIELYETVLLVRVDDKGVKSYTIKDLLHLKTIGVANKIVAAIENSGKFDFTLMDQTR
jgi:hypothetical protein